MACCCDRVSCADLGLSYEKPDVFCKPQWKWIPFGVFALYRLLVASYFFGILVTYLTRSMASGLGGDTFLFLTNWGFILVTLYLFVAATGTMYRYFIYRRAPPTTSSATDYEAADETSPLTESGMARCLETPWYFKLSWLLFNVSALTALVITLVYWPALSGSNTGIPFALDFHIHALNSVVIVLELLFASMPIRYLHVFYVIALGIVYILATVIAYYTGWKNPFDGESYVYPFLDYSEKPGLAAVSVIAIVIGAFLLQLVLWAIFKLKLRLAGLTGQSTTASAAPSSFSVSMEKQEGAVSQESDTTGARPHEEKT
ncbi:protein rolling stone-like [Ptychodera flava]|uniref:protein rolling stone-like n=1 Tax=Ptychodera flava TaxID=63121 RepID=UPI003969C627